MNSLPALTRVERHGQWSYVAVLDSWFWREWQTEWGPPAVVAFLTLSSLLLALTLFQASRTIAMFLAFFGSVFFYCYFRTIRDGPGYWPFFWAANMPQENSLDGLITTPEQLEWARSNPRPPRSALSRSARRFVIRPDHECCYTACWIGKRNHKFFILFNIYGFVYLAGFTIVAGARVFSWLNRNEFSFGVLVGILYVVLGLNFTMMTGYFGITSIVNMINGVTEWEIYKGIVPSAFDRGCVENIEDVCGSRKMWFLWMLPVSPWEGLGNTEITAGYAPYVRV